MAGKFRVTMDMDFGEIVPEVMNEADVQEAVAQVFTTNVLANSRARARDQFRAAQRDNAADEDVKTIKMGEALRSILMSVMGEANLRVTPLPDSAVIQTELPFEKRYAA